MQNMEATAREFHQKPSRILAAAARGETVTVTKNGTPAARFIERGAATRRFEVPAVSGHLSAAIAVAEGHADADGGEGIGLTDAMNVALAAAYRTDTMFTTDRHVRMVRPLTGHAAFRLLPDDLRSATVANDGGERPGSAGRLAVGQTGAVADETTPGAEVTYYTVHECTGCGGEVHGLQGLWACAVCGTCSPYEPAVVPAPEPVTPPVVTAPARAYYTVHTCTGCGAEVHGLQGRWACAQCGVCSPYEEPAEGWQADIGYRRRPKLPRKPRY